MEPSFPRGPRAALTPSLLQALQEKYGLGPLQECEDLGGAYNLNLRLQTATGAYVARVYRPWVARERLDTLQGVKHWLLTQQIPVILPLPTTSGTTMARHAGRLIELEPFVLHTPGKESWPRYEQAFALLGQLHTALANYPAAAMATPPVENYAVPAKLMEWIENVKGDLRRRGRGQVEEAVQICEEATTLLQQLMPWWRKTKGHLPQQLIHGDYGVGNLLWQEEHVIAIGDFEFLAVHERVYDLAYALYWMFDRIEGTTAVQDRSWERMAEMVAAYDDSGARPLSPLERRAIPLEMARVPLYWIGEARFLNDPLQAIVLQARHITVARWLVEEAGNYVL